MSEDSNKLLENLMGMLGDNPSEKLGQMLSALTGPQNDVKEETANAQAEKPQEATGGGFDPAMFLKLQNLMGQLGQQGTDDRSALLTAIKPFLSEEKKPQIDQAIKLLKLSQLAKTAQDLDLFKGLL